MLATGEPPRTTMAPRLTQKETMIIFLMSAGHTTPEIARLLDLRPRTVENHKRHIYEKLGVGSQSHAVAKAIWLGLLKPGPPRLRSQPGPQDQEMPSGEQEHILARLSGEPGRALLAVLLGRPGNSKDEMALRLISERVPCVVALTRDGLVHDHWMSWHAGPAVVVLVDPEPEDWAPAIALGAPVVVVHGSDVPEQHAITDALARRVSGLIAVADTASGLLPILTVAAQGMLVMGWRYAEALLKWAPSPPRTVPELTARERDILDLLACGHTIRQTARALGIAAKTVENTQARLFRKLGARNRMEALTIADGWGLIDRTILPVSDN